MSPANTMKINRNPSVNNSAGKPRFMAMLTQPKSTPAPTRQNPRLKQDFLQQILDTSKAPADAESTEAMLRAIAAQVMRAASGTGAGAHVAMLMYIDVDAEGKPEWASVVASVGEAAVPVGIRFYLPGTSPTESQSQNHVFPGFSAILPAWRELEATLAGQRVTRLVASFRRGRWRHSASLPSPAQHGQQGDGGQDKR